MIGKIKGILAEIDQNVGLIETPSGLSYRVFLTPGVTKSVTIGQNIELVTYLQVRDDALILFGFETKKEHDFFKLLLTVSGVGPKTAFLVISITQLEELIQAIKENDLNYFSKISGLGKKTAMKIILELSQKLKEDFKMEKMYMSDDDKTVIDALVALGFKTQEAKKIFQQIPKDLSVEQKISEGIRVATKK